MIYTKNVIRLSLLAGCGALLLQSCQKDEPLKSGLYPSNMDTLVKPGDDFDAYVNGTWVKKNKIPGDKSSYGIFEILDDKSQDDVKAIIEESSKGSFFRWVERAENR